MKRVAVVALLAVNLAACSQTSQGGLTESDEAGTSASTPRATLTASQFQPPRQKNEGRPDVVYDPCTYIDDSVIASAGFDPASRERSDYPGEYTFFDCKFESPTQLLTISSSNFTMEEERVKFAGSIEDLKVNGRDAILVKQVDSPKENCALNLRTQQGYARIFTMLKISAIGKVDACANILDIARIIEPTIGKGN